MKQTLPAHRGLGPTLSIGRAIDSLLGEAGGFGALGCGIVGAALAVIGDGKLAVRLGEGCVGGDGHFRVRSCLFGKSMKTTVNQTAASRPTKFRSSSPWQVNMSCRSHTASPS